MNIQIKGGRVIDPLSDLDRVQDLFITDNKIVGLGQAPMDYEADTIIDASGQVVCPGLVDMRARLREPGLKHKGTIVSETKAAVSGGVTTLCCPPDTDPVIDSAAVVELIHQNAEHAGNSRVLTYGALTKGLDGEHISEMAALQKAGCVGLSNAYRPVNTEVMRRAMEYAASHGITVYLHAEDPALSADGCVHEGIMSVRLGLPGIPEAAETLAVGQALQLIDMTGVDAHFCQISSAASIKMIARAQYDGLPITIDVAAHYLFLTELDIGYFNSQCHVRPPLRTQRDQDALRNALVEGTISAICSDHQPHDIDAKLAPFPSTEPGISTIETLLPLTLRLVEQGVMELPDALARITQLPANILGVKVGSLRVKKPADICIFDPELSWQLDDTTMESFGHNTPFMGWEFKGRVTNTLVDGKLVYQLGENTQTQ
jgi:dihydroorotase